MIVRDLVHAGLLALTGFLGALLGATVAPRAAAERRDLECTNLSIKDATGVTRLELGCEPSGNPSIRMSDAQGRLRLGVRVQDSKGPSIVVMDKEGQVESKPGHGIRLSLRYNDEMDTPEIVFWDTKGNGRASFVQDGQGRVSLRFMDDKGKTKTLP